MTKYVVGFMFDPKEYGVLLIKKKKPDWQKGKLNGIGGKIEEGETSFEAMRREFREEVGIDYTEWSYVITMYGEDWSVDVFSAIAYQVHGHKKMEKEVPVYIGLHELDKYPLISNLYWLIPMCLDKIDYKLSNEQSSNNAVETKYEEVAFKEPMCRCGMMTESKCADTYACPHAIHV